MAATAERIQKEFATLSRHEREELVVNRFQVLQTELAANWPLSTDEETALRKPLPETKQDFESGRGIPHEEIVRDYAPWRKPAS